MLQATLAQSRAKGDQGEVYLVGAGPGDPDLLTFRALRLMQQADVVLYDRLVTKEIMRLVRQDAERIHVGKKRSDHTMPQEEISRLMVTLAQQGKRVLRLKGGDPFVFGRGGEEAQALMEARIPFTVVPGITSAIGVPAAAGIPVTHRNVSPAFTVVTGHRENGGSTNIAWEALAQVGGTIVVLMGVSERAQIAERLMAGGLVATTPVAAIRWGTRAEQVVVRTTLGELGTAALKAPSTIVIGAVAAYEFLDSSITDHLVAGA